ncbi:MAG: hypothetical protein AABX65_02550 [Nanoarchaeota archaeon]
MAKFENVLFWILIILVVGIAVWKIIGSPTDTSALISITLFIASSEILLWKAFFNTDKKTAIGFNNIKNDIVNLKRGINLNMENINDKLNNLEKIMIKQRK